MSPESDDINWKKIGISAVVTFFVSLMAFSAFTFIIEPAVTDKPEVEPIVIEPKLVDAGESVSFNITLENVGKRTASDLFCYACEKYSDTEPCSQFARPEVPSFLPTGETTHLIFSLTAPTEDNAAATWSFELSISYKFGGKAYYRSFDIIYEYLADSNQYHKISP